MSCSAANHPLQAAYSMMIQIGNTITGNEDPPNVYRRAEEETTDRFQGNVGQGYHKGRDQGGRLRG